MKALLINGSPRKGNTYEALKAVIRGFGNINGMEMSTVDAAKVKVAPCMACDACTENGRCVFNDDTNPIMDAVMESDMIVFATPVYWWGVTAQMKTIIDKLYSKVSAIQADKAGKKIGLIVTGEAEQDNPQYKLIEKQFRCICEYLGWELIFSKSYTALAPDELASNRNAISQLENLWKEI